MHYRKWILLYIYLKNGYTISALTCMHNIGSNFLAIKKCETVYTIISYN